MSELIIEPRVELGKFIVENGLSYHEVGKLLRVSKTAVSYWVTGKRVPTPPVRLQLEAFTRGRIKAADWETGKERTRRRLREDFEARAAASRKRPRRTLVHRTGAAHAATG